MYENEFIKKINNGCVFWSLKKITIHYKSSTVTMPISDYWSETLVNPAS